MASFASVYSSHRSSEARSVADSFHCRTGSTWRMTNRVRCSPRDTENQNLTRWIPDRTHIRSSSGASRMNSRYSAREQKAITRSTPARLYQDRSKKTISPARLDPLLQLQQLDLQQALVVLVLLAGQPLVVGVALPPGLYGLAVRAEQDRVVVIVVVDPVVLEPLQQVDVLVAHTGRIPPAGPAESRRDLVSQPTGPPTGCPASGQVDSARRSDPTIRMRRWQ